jgi:predicted membrane protein
MMNYLFRRIFIVAFCGLFVVIGAASLLYMLWHLQFTAFGVLFGAGFFFIGLYIMITQLRQLSRFETMTYTWYKNTHPEQVKGNKVSCFSCGNSHVKVRHLMNQTFHREHFCPQCGTALYYSPE